MSDPPTELIGKYVELLRKCKETHIIKTKVRECNRDMDTLGHKGVTFQTTDQKLMFFLIKYGNKEYEKQHFILNKIIKNDDEVNIVFIHINNEENFVLDISYAV